MLVLSRKLDQDILIDQNVVVRVLSIRGDKVRLGIIAPEDVRVHRREVAQAIALEKAAAQTPEKAVA